MRINHTIAAVCVWFGLAPAFGQTALYVDDNAPLGGDGTAWATAYRHLQDALAVASLGDEIRVAQGVYRPDDSEGGVVVSGDRAARFQLILGTSLRGGYAGIGAGDPDARDPNTFITVLSGDLDDNDDPNDLDDDPNAPPNSRSENAFRIVECTGATPGTVIEGFVITGGHADERPGNGNGGGLGWSGDLLVRRCRFTLNRAWVQGGAARGNGGVIEDCVFERNHCVERGGGLFGNSDAGELVIRRCRFTRNTSHDVYSANGTLGMGGGAYVRCDGGATIEDCVFEESLANAEGAALNCVSTDGFVTIRGTRFERNVSRGALALRSDSLIEDCDFIDNAGDSAAPLGNGNSSALQVVAGAAQIERCRFRGNTNLSGGAAIKTGLGQGDVFLTVLDCNFVGNSGTAGFSAGGAINIQHPQPHLIRGCRFIRNHAVDLGGAVAVVALDPFGDPIVRIENCEFFGNYIGSATGVRIGGALRGTQFVTCHDSVFVGNSAGAPGIGGPGRGGAIFNCAAVVNCTIAFNNAGLADSGGGLSSVTNVTNCIIWGNSADGAPNQFPSADSPIVRFSNIADDDPNDGLLPFGGAANGNISADPAFIRDAGPGPDGQFDGVDDDYGNMRLDANSPCLDAGSNDDVERDASDVDCDGDILEPVPLDVGGLPRFVDDPVADTGVGTSPIVDMGAHERGPFSGQIVFVDVAATGAANGANWTDAFPSLSAALQSIATVNCGALEVLVAGGTYTPADGNSLDPNATFALRDGVAILGGYAGGTFPTPDDRDPNLYPTILSGDLLGNDAPNSPASRADNVRHVVTAAQSGLAILDGVRITGGVAADPNVGGGVLASGEATLRRCVVEGNTGACGGDVRAIGAILSLEDVMLQGEVSLDQSALTLTGDVLIAGGSVSTYSSAISGNGTVVLDAASVLSIGATPACGAEFVESASGAFPASTLFAPLDPNTGVNARWQISALISDLLVEGPTERWVVGSTAHGPATLTWTSLLDDDLSANGRADARFVRGTFTLAGPVSRAADPNAPPLFTGVLLAGEVSAFRLRETDPNINALSYRQGEEAVLTPTSGFLIQNTEGLLVAGRQFISLTLDSVTQDGGALTSFQGDLATSSTTVRVEPVNPPDRALRVSAAINGAGNIQIGFGAALVVEGAGVLNLSGVPEQLCNGQDQPGVTTSGGMVDVSGSLVVRDSARVENTDVRVKLLDLKDQNRIVHNDIRLLESSSGFGGEFFVSDQAIISCNRIISDGDRYLDLDPDPTDAGAPTITNNLIDVIIRQGVESQQGELLELRSVDADYALGAGASGAYVLNDSNGFRGTWTLESLEVRPNAKVNLTNRPGFTFQPSEIMTPEALYVRTLKLGAGATLNTGLQRLYYQSLTDANGFTLAPPDANGLLANGARIVDVPLLGYSLRVISMEDDTEFSVRVRKRLEDTANDTQPSNPSAPRKRGAISRLNDGAHGGVMEMRTRAIGADSASTVAAKGAFARAGEENVTVVFEYLFQQVSAEPNQPTELRVFVSDAPEVGAGRRLVGRIRPPTAGRGAVGAGEFATFRITTSGANMNYRRGVYIELELAGADSVVWIDEFDPDVDCSNACGDLDGLGTVDNIDFIIAISSIGRDIEDSFAAACVDYPSSGDGYVDIADALDRDAQRVGGPCASGLGFGARGVPIPATVPCEARLLAAAKRVGGFEDSLYPLDGNAMLDDGGILDPASTPNATFGYRANGGLSVASDGAIYQINATQGLIALNSAAVVIHPQQINMPGGSKVFLGGLVNAGFEYLGAPLRDVAFHPSAPTIAYIAPVVIEPSDFDPNNAPRYRAAAKVDLTCGGGCALDDGQVSILSLYAVDPQEAGINTSPPYAAQTRYDVVKEVEADGNTVLVLSGYADNDNDWLLAFDDATGAWLGQSNISAVAEGARAMLWSSFSRDTVYVAPSQLDSNATQPGATLVRRIHFARAGSAASFSPGGAPTIVPAPPLDPNLPAGLDPAGRIGQLTSLAERPEDGTLYALSFVMPSLVAEYQPGVLSYDTSIIGLAAPPVVPALARIPFGSPTPEWIARPELMGLPVGLVYIPGSLEECAPCGIDCTIGAADITGDCAVDLADLAGLLAAFGTSSGQPAYDPAADLDDNGAVDLADLAGVLAVFGESCQ